MASIGQLLISGQGAKSRRDIERAQEQEMARRQRAAKAGGWGRALGFGGSFLATLGMANPLLAAGLTGLGALAGRSAGRALYGGRERDANKEINTDFYQGAQRDFKKEIGDYQQGMRERMLMDTGRDAFSAYNLGKYMKPKTTINPEMAKTINQAKDSVNYVNQAQNVGVSSSSAGLNNQLTSASRVTNPLDSSLLNLVESPAVNTAVNQNLPINRNAIASGQDAVGVDQIFNEIFTRNQPATNPNSPLLPQYQNNSGFYNQFSTLGGPYN